MRRELIRGINAIENLIIRVDIKKTKKKIMWLVKGYNYVAICGGIIQCIDHSAETSLLSQRARSMAASDSIGLIGWVVCWGTRAPHDRGANNLVGGSIEKLTTLIFDLYHNYTGVVPYIWMFQSLISCRWVSFPHRIPWNVLLNWSQPVWSESECVYVCLCAQ